MGDNEYAQETFQSGDKNLNEGKDGSITVRKTVKRLSRNNTKRIVIGDDMQTLPIFIDSK